MGVVRYSSSRPSGVGNGAVYSVRDPAEIKVLLDAQRTLLAADGQYNFDSFTM